MNRLYTITLLIFFISAGCVNNTAINSSTPKNDLIIPASWLTYTDSDLGFTIKYPENFLHRKIGGAQSKNGIMQTNILFTSDSQLRQLDEVIAEDKERCGNDLCTSTIFVPEGIYINFYNDVDGNYGEKEFQSRGEESIGTIDVCGDHSSIVISNGDGGDYKWVKIFTKKVGENQFVMGCATKYFEDNARLMIYSTASH